MDVVFEKFYDGDIEDLEEAQDVIKYYEWNIADNDISGRVVNKWTLADVISSINTTHVRVNTFILCVKLLYLYLLVTCSCIKIKPVRDTCA